MNKWHLATRCAKVGKTDRKSKKEENEEREVNKFPAL